MVEAAVQRNINFNLTASMNSVFNANTNFNLTFADNVLYSSGTTVDYQTDGITNVISVSATQPTGSRIIVSGMNITITLNTAALSNPSQEFVTATILHEVLHAYFRYVNNSSSFDHYTMVSEYIPWFVAALTATYPNLSTADATALAYGGLTDQTNAMATVSPSVLNSYNLVNASYKNASSGTPCH